MNMIKLFRQKGSSISIYAQKTHKSVSLCGNKNVAGLRNDLDGNILAEVLNFEYGMNSFLWNV